MINIVQDLMLLSELENSKLQLELEEVSMTELVNNILPLFTQKLKAKNIAIEVITEKDLPRIKADAFRLEQALINLIDNAVKYTETGKIIVRMALQDHFLMITVEDSGLGIPEEALSRLFERFYVVDKSRSRKQGGTGLGLSIVKHIALLHQGKVEVKSVEGKGSSFTIYLPLEQ
jgi:two-component system phosphate regulon sensor histidine kinase PhoR